MPYELTWENRGVYRKYYGDVTIAQRRASLNEICRDPRFDSLLYSITDFLEVDAYEFTAEASAELAALHVGPLITNRRLIMAAVAVRPDLLAAIQAFMDHKFTSTAYRVFPTVGEARDWIASASGAA